MSTTCNDCGTALKPLFGTKMYCPNDCDRVKHGASSAGDRKPKTTAHRCLDGSSGDDMPLPLTHKTKLTKKIAGGGFPNSSKAREATILVRKIVSCKYIDDSRNKLAILLSDVCNNIRTSDTGRLEINLKKGFTTKDLPLAVSHGASKITVDDGIGVQKVLKDVNRGVRPIFT